jgi:hypothetical protein
MSRNFVEEAMIRNLYGIRYQEAYQHPATGLDPTKCENCLPPFAGNCLVERTESTQDYKTDGRHDRKKECDRPKPNKKWRGCQFQNLNIEGFLGWKLH